MWLYSLPSNKYPRDIRETGGEGGCHTASQLVVISHSGCSHPLELLPPRPLGSPVGARGLVAEKQVGWCGFLPGAPVVYAFLTLSCVPFFKLTIRFSARRLYTNKINICANNFNQNFSFIFNSFQMRHQGGCQELAFRE